SRDLSLLPRVSPGVFLFEPDAPSVPVGSGAVRLDQHGQRVGLVAARPDDQLGEGPRDPLGQVFHARPLRGVMPGHDQPDAHRPRLDRPMEPRLARQQDLGAEPRRVAQEVVPRPARDGHPLDDDRRIAGHLERRAPQSARDRPGELAEPRTGAARRGAAGNRETIKAMRERAGRFEDEVEALRGKNVAAERKVTELEMLVQDYDKKTARLRGEVEALRGKNDAAESRVEELERLVQDYEKETARLQKISQAHIGQVESLQSEINDLRSTLEHEKSSKAKELQCLARGKAHLDVWNKSLRCDLSEKEKKLQELKNEATTLRRASGSVDGYIVQIESLQNEVEELRSRLENEKGTSQREMKARAAEKNHLEVWITSLQKLLEDAQAKEEGNRHIVAEAEASKAELENGIRILEAHLAGRNAIAEKRREEIVALAAVNERLSEQIRSLRQNQEPRETSPAQVDGSKVEISDLENRLKAAEARVTERDVQIKTLTVAKANLRQHIENFRQHRASQKRVMAELEETKRALTIDINSLEASLAASDATEEVLRQQVARLTAANACLTTQCQTYYQMQHEETYHRLPEDARTLTRRLEARIAALETNLNASHVVGDKRGREIDGLNSQIAALTSQNESLRQKEEMYPQVVAGVDAAKVEFGTRIESLEISLKASEAIAEEQRREIRTLTADNAHLRKRIQCLCKQEERYGVAAPEAATEGTRREITILAASNTTVTEPPHTLHTQQQQQTHHRLPTPPNPPRPHQNKLQIRKFASLKRNLRTAHRMMEYQKKTIQAKYKRIVALKTAKVGLKRDVKALKSQLAEAMRVDLGT
ncbi:hypothetical protein HK102_008533, partial [Quaeritorhiza haematococci]